MGRRERTPEGRGPSSGPLATSGVMCREERLETGEGARLPPPALVRKVTFPHDFQPAHRVQGGRITLEILPIAEN